MSTETCVMYYCYLHTLIHTDPVSAIYIAADSASLITGEYCHREAVKNGQEKQTLFNTSEAECRN